MFRGLEHKAVIWLLIYGLFDVKNRYGSSQKHGFCKNSSVMLILNARFLSFQAFFQAMPLEHFEIAKVKYDPSL
jgi:multidrug transporter EmrE-like cation transporter